MNKYMIPGMFEHFYLLKKIIIFFKEFPEFLKDNTTIGAAYGNFQFCPWDGGRIITQKNSHQATYEDIINVRDFYHEFNIPLRLIFTNPIIEERHLYDRFCNLTAELCESPNNEIVVNSPLLEQYLRDKYPAYKFISSTTKCNKAENTLKELEENKYFMLCLDYNLNKNKKFIEEQIPVEKRDKIEMLCNAICGPACPFRREHYNANGFYNLTKGNIPYAVSNCQIKHSVLHPETQNYKNNIKPIDIENYYAPLGYHNFKLEGRTLSEITVLLSISDYMVKPEYKSEFIMRIIDNDI